MALYVSLGGSCEIIDDITYCSLCHILGEDFKRVECDDYIAYTSGISAMRMNPVATQIMHTIGPDDYVYGGAIFVGRDNTKLTAKQLTELQLFGELD